MIKKSRKLIKVSNILANNVAKRLTSQDDLTKHREAVHEGIKHACGLCGKGFISQSNLAEHRRAVHEGIKFPCGQCGKKYTSQDDFAKHRRAVHEGVKHPCGQCGKKYTSQDDLANTEWQFMKESSVLAGFVAKDL